MNEVVNVLLATPADRTEYPASSNMTIKEFLDEHNCPIGTSTLMLDGMTLTPETLRQSFAQLGATGDCTLAVCTKLANA